MTQCKTRIHLGKPMLPQVDIGAAEREVGAGSIPSNRTRLRSPFLTENHRGFQDCHRDGRAPREPYGAFRCIAPGGIALAIIATNGEDPSGANWEHVSVSTAQRAPRWDEMCWVKDRFWEPEDTVVQYHPPKSLYVNCHPYTLHLW